MLSYVYNKIFQKSPPNSANTTPAKKDKKDQKKGEEQPKDENMMVDSDNENNSPSMMDVDLNVTGSEKSKGGLKYEVKLAEANIRGTPVRAPSPSRALTPLSVDRIQERLEKAAERRKSLRTEKLQTVQTELKKIDEVAKKKLEGEQKFISTVKENLENRLDTASGKRKSIICDLKERLNQHNQDHLKEVRQQMETSVTEFEGKVKEVLDKKLETAEQNREKVIQTKLETLKKHDEKVVQVLSQKKSTDMEVDNENGENAVTTSDPVAVVTEAPTDTKTSEEEPMKTD